MKYWTQLNKGYNMSRIFGNRVRFANDPAADPENSGDDGGANGGSGGAEDSEALIKAQAERDAEIARNAKLKNSLDKTMKELSELKKKQREQMTSEQQAQLAHEEHEQELAELRAKLRAKEYTERLMEIGMSKAEATELSGTLPVFADDDAAETFFSKIGTYIESAKKQAREDGIQKFITDNHVDIAGGTGANNPVNLAVEKAKALRESRTAGANTDILSRFKR